MLGIAVMMIFRVLNISAEAASLLLLPLASLSSCNMPCPSNPVLHPPQLQLLHTLRILSIIIIMADPPFDYLSVKFLQHISLWNESGIQIIHLLMCRLSQASSAIIFFL